ncbi:hypothetical protein Tco_1165307 [Tanacetum coccineum]
MLGSGPWCLCGLGPALRVRFFRCRWVSWAAPFSPRGLRSFTAGRLSSPVLVLLTCCCHFWPSNFLFPFLPLWYSPVPVRSRGSGVLLQLICLCYSLFGACFFTRSLFSLASVTVGRVLRSLSVSCGMFTPWCLFCSCLSRYRVARLDAPSGGDGGVVVSVLTFRLAEPRWSRELLGVGCGPAPGCAVIRGRISLDLLVCGGVRVLTYVVPVVRDPFGVLLLWRASHVLCPLHPLFCVLFACTVWNLGWRMFTTCFPRWGRCYFSSRLRDPWRLVSVTASPCLGVVVDCVNLFSVRTAAPLIFSSCSWCSLLGLLCVRRVSVRVVRCCLVSLELWPDPLLFRWLTTVVRCTRDAWSSTVCCLVSLTFLALSLYLWRARCALRLVVCVCPFLPFFLFSACLLLYYAFSHAGSRRLALADLVRLRGLLRAVLAWLPLCSH